MIDTQSGNEIYKEIVKKPNDIDLRLIYADWLEDVGGVKNCWRARFIRKGVLEGTKHQCVAYKGPHYVYGGRHACDVWPGAWAAFLDDVPSCFEVVYVNGMIEEVIGGIFEFLSFSRYFVTHYPLKFVHIVDRVPYRTIGGFWGWAPDEYEEWPSARLSDSILKMMRRLHPTANLRAFPTEETARNALSVSLIELAKERANG